MGNLVRLTTAVDRVSGLRLRRAGVCGRCFRHSEGKRQDVYGILAQSDQYLSPMSPLAVEGSVVPS